MPIITRPQQPRGPAAGSRPAGEWKSGAAGAAPGRHSKLPNIVWIQTDEQRPDSLGCYGSAWAKTPNIDALAARGVLMRHCVCQSPVCVPSRSSQLTSVYPQECNVLLNNEVAGMPDVFPEGTITFPEALATAGYQTINIGKSHTPRHPTWQESTGTHGGLDREIAGFMDMGPAYNEAEYDIVKRPGIHHIIIGGRYPKFWGNPTMELTDQALNFMRERDQDRPFMLRLSLNWPHTPVMPPPPFDRLYCEGEVPVQEYDPAAVASRADYDQTLARAQRMEELSPEEYHQQWRHYMGLVGYVDYEVGRLLAGMTALGLTEDTLIFFSSDHGRALGEYGHGEKCTFDEQVWTVPWIWHWPGRLPEGEVREDLCELVDTGRTLLSLAGLEDAIPSHWRGRNLFGAAPPPEAEQAVFSQVGWPNRKAPLLDLDRVRESHERTGKAMGMSVETAYPIHGLMRVAIRTQRYRMDLNWMQDGKRIPLEEADGNLFDLREDPLEKRNLWNDPESVSIVKALHERMEAWYGDLARPEGVFGRA